MKYIPAPASSASRRATSAIVVWPKTLRREVMPSAQIPRPLLGLLADLAVEGLDDLEDGDFVGRTGERVAAFHPPVGGQEAAAAQGREQLLEELLGHPAALGDLFDRDRALAGARQLRHRDDGVAGLRGDRDHLSFLPHGPDPARLGSSFGFRAPTMPCDRRTPAGSPRSARSPARRLPGPRERQSRRGPGTDPDVGDIDVTIVDLRRWGNGEGADSSGREAIRALHRAEPGMGIVAHGERPERHIANAALQAGATAYVARTASPEDLRRAVEAAIEQERFVDPEVPPKGSRGQLTSRQRQILQLIANGGSTTAAARELGLSEETVKTHTEERARPARGPQPNARGGDCACVESLIE